MVQVAKFASARFATQAGYMWDQLHCPCFQKAVVVVQKAAALSSVAAPHWVDVARTHVDDHDDGALIMMEFADLGSARAATQEGYLILLSQSCCGGAGGRCTKLSRKTSLGQCQ